LLKTHVNLTLFTIKCFSYWHKQMILAFRQSCACDYAEKYFVITIVNMDDSLHACSTSYSPPLLLKRVENLSCLLACLQPPPETPRRCIHCHPVHVPSTPNNYMQHPMQYYTPTHCVEGQNGTYTPHRGSSYHGGESTFQFYSNIYQIHKLL